MRSISGFIVLTSCVVALAGCSEAVVGDPNATAASLIRGGVSTSGGSTASTATTPAAPSEPAMSFSEEETGVGATASAPTATTGNSDSGSAVATATNATPTEPAAAPTGTLTPQSVVRCSHRQQVTLSNVAIDGRNRAAIEASGSCHVTITSCTLASDRVAISAAGESQIDLVDCVVTGERGAVAASGTSAVRLTRGSVTGSVRAAGRATVERDGASIAE